MLIGLYGKEIYVQSDTWLVSGNDKFDLKGQSSCHYYKPIDKSLKDELFRTLMAEVEGVMSFRSFK